MLFTVHVIISGRHFITFYLLVLIASLIYKFDRVLFFREEGN